MLHTEAYTILNIDGILVKIAYRSIKNINIYMKPPFWEVLVTAPKYMREEQVINFIKEKEMWIRQHRSRMREKNENSGKGQMESERKVTGEQLAWLKDRIEFYAKKWEPVMGVHCEHWTIRDMKTRWGSCTVQKRTIRINLQLAKKSEECIEYVIVHELTHLLEPSHNKRFHAYMEKFLPDYKNREKML